MKGNSRKTGACHHTPDEEAENQQPGIGGSKPAQQPEVSPNQQHQQ